MSKNESRETKVIRALVRTALAIAAATVLAYPLDWAVWQARVAMGGGMGTATVDRFTVAELKGNKEEYYPDGSTVVACSKSVFPEAGSGACWWLERHRTVITQY